MKISETVNYAAAPQDVFTMLTDEAFQERKCIDAGAIRHDVAVTLVAEGARIVARRDLRTDRFPDFAKSLVGKSVSITETYHWGAAQANGSRRGEVTVEVAGAPVALRGKVELVPTGVGSTIRINGDLKASIPLLGGRVERAAAPAVLGAIRGEGQTGARWLAERA